MAVLNYFSITFIVFSIFFNNCLYFDFKIFSGLSLKNLSMYFSLIVIFLNYIFTDRNRNYFKDKKTITLFIVYMLIIYILFIYKNLLKYNFINFDQMTNLKSSLDPFLVFVIIMSLNLKKQILYNFLLIVSLMLFILNLITIFDALGIYNIERIDYDNVYGRTDGAFGEPNTYSAFVSYLIPFLLYYSLKFKNKFIKSVYYLQVCLAFFVILLTGSRTGILSVLISFFVFVSFIINKCNKEIDFIFYKVVFLSLIAIGVSIFYLPDLSLSGLENNILYRSRTSIDEYSSGRIELWSEGMRYISKNLLLGNEYSFSKVIGSNSHNTYLEILFEYGLISLLLFLIIFYRFFSTILKFSTISKDHLLYISAFSSLVSFFVSMFFLNMFSSYYFFLICIALVLKLGLIDLKDYASQ